MKKLGFALLGLVVLLIAAVLIGPSFVDWNAHKGRIAAEVEKLTGRPLTIDGDITLAVLPAPTLSADKVRLANIAGGSSPSMVELESLEVRIALIPLVQGEVQVESVALVRPTILAEVLGDGRKNWEIVPGEDAAPAAAPTSESVGGLGGQIRLDSVRISDGTLIYRDAPGGREERITGLDAEVVAGSLNGPFSVTGGAMARDVRTEFEVTVGQLVQEGASSLSVNLTFPEAGADVRFNGAISLHQGATSLRGGVKAQGDDLAAVLALLSGGGPVVPVFERSFAVETEISADTQQVSASALSLRLGDTAVDGEVQVKLGTPVDARVTISASRLNLDKLLAAEGAGRAGDGQAGGQADGQGGKQANDQAGAAAPPDSAPFALPQDIDGSLEVTVDALVYRRQVVRQVLLSLAMSEGRLQVTQALALLPGGSDVSLTGTLAAPGDAAAGSDPRFNGRLEAASDNLRGIFDWLGVDVSAVPAERLRRMNLSARIDATPRQATVSEIDLRIDVSRVTGGIVVALRDRPGFGIGLAADKLNLDAYLPPATAAQKQEKEKAAAQGAPAGQAGAGTATATAATAPGSLAALAGFDANLDLSLGSLSLRGVTARNLRLDATLQQGSLILREVLIGDLAGSRARAAGTIAGLTTTPSADAEVELSVADPARLAKFANLEGDALARLGAFDVLGTVKGTAEQIDLDARIDALGGRLGVLGRVQSVAATPAFDVKMTAKHPNLATLVAALEPGLKLGRKLGGLELSARLSGTTKKIQVSDLTGQVGPAQVSGSLTADLSGPQPAVSPLDLAVAVKHPNLAELVKAISAETALNPNLGGIDLKGRITGEASVYQVSDLAGRLGPTDLSGSLGADLSGAKPALTIDLTTGEFPVGAFGAETGAKGGTGAGGGAASGTTGQAATAGGRWSTQPIDVSALNAVDAEVKLTSTALIFDKLRLDKALLEASLAGGILDLRKLNGTAYGGALSVSGKVDARKTLEAGLAVTAIELNLARVLKDLAESDRVSGPLSINASLTTRGRSEAELVSALTGTGDLNGTLQVKAKKEEKVGSLLLGILGQKVKEIRGVTDATNVLFGAFADAPAAVKGMFVVERGVARTQDLRVDGRQATALTQGTADLPAWQLNTRTDVYRAEDPNTPYLTVDLRGPLDAPNPRLRGGPVQRQQQAPATGPTPSTGPAPSGQAQPQPAPKPASPEDLLKEGLKKGLKGLFGN